MCVPVEACCCSFSIHQTEEYFPLFFNPKYRRSWWEPSWDASQSSTLAWRKVYSVPSILGVLVIAFLPTDDQFKVRQFQYLGWIRCFKLRLLEITFLLYACLMFCWLYDLIFLRYVAALPFLVCHMLEIVVFQSNWIQHCLNSMARSLCAILFYLSSSCFHFSSFLDFK